MAADTYDVSVTRSLSEGITGYEVRTSSLYGRVTSLSEGSLYIDVDTDSHSVVSLNGEEDASKEYMFSTGIMSSLYESTVWEELTGNESVSTISILNTAREEGIDILLL
ncbi:MAG: transglutaminase, partial [Lachnospiraceae bacterium]|nr:transglutaminase [Lachnospiraceae bacterium]